MVSVASADTSLWLFSGIPSAAFLGGLEESFQVGREENEGVALVFNHPARLGVTASRSGVVNLTEGVLLVPALWCLAASLAEQPWARAVTAMVVTIAERHMGCRRGRSVVVAE